MSTHQQETGKRLLWQGEGEQSDFQESRCASRRAHIHQSVPITHVFPKPLITALLSHPASGRGSALKAGRITAAQSSPCHTSLQPSLCTASCAAPLMCSVCIRPQVLPHQPKTLLCSCLCMCAAGHQPRHLSTSISACWAPGPASRHFPPLLSFGSEQQLTKTPQHSSLVETKRCIHQLPLAAQA